MKTITYYNLWSVIRSEFLSTRVFSYEALKSDTRGVFQQILQAVGIEAVDEGLLAQVMAESSFQRLHEHAL